jgi:hypothetical protein
VGKPDALFAAGFRQSLAEQQLRALPSRSVYAFFNFVSAHRNKAACNTGAIVQFHMRIPGRGQL